jgi:phosphoketolase
VSPPVVARRGRARSPPAGSNKFLDPALDGAVLSMLHPNGYKIAYPTVIASIPEEELLVMSVWVKTLTGQGAEPSRPHT